MNNVGKGVCYIIFFSLLSGMAAMGQGLHLPDKHRAVSDTTGAAPVSLSNLKPAPSIKYNYYQSLGTACKVELKLEQATKVPFRFRLGSLQQTDYLEQKPNAQKPQ